MKLLGRAGRPTPHPGLDGRLRDIFDDGRTPGASEALYAYLREVPMDSSEEGGHGRLGLAWHGLGRTGRAAASLAVVVVVAAGVVAVTVGLPRSTGAGSNPSAEPSPAPTAPSPPAGWSLQAAFGEGSSSGGSVGANLLPPAPRIAIHVVCNGPDDLVVLATTDAGMGLPYGRAVQAVPFQCYAEGHEGRVELTAPTGAFQKVFAAVIRSPSSLAYTSFMVSIEVPDKTPAPSPSS